MNQSKATPRTVQISVYLHEANTRIMVNFGKRVCSCVTETLQTHFDTFLNWLKNSITAVNLHEPKLSHSRVCLLDASHFDL